MKKICFFSGDITRSGGTERVSIMIANELAKQGKYDICFLSLCEQKAVPFFAIHENINRHKLGEKWIQPGPGYLPVVPKLRRFLKEQAIDVIIDIDIALDILSVPAAGRLKVKVVSWEHSNCAYEMSVFYRKAILKYAVKHTDYVITLTEEDRLSYGKLVHRHKNIEAIYNPMNQRSSLKGLKKENWIITAGRLVPEKGIDYLVNVALEILTKYPEWKWYVLGEGPERGLLEEVIQQYGLEERLLVPGLVTNVEDYLEQAKLFVLTSKREGLPMCLLEAKTYNLPCVSFDIATGPNEIIEDGVTGFLIEPFDCDDMTDKISTLIENEAMLQEFSRNAGNNVEKFQLNEIMKKWNRVLNNLCE